MTEKINSAAGLRRVDVFALDTAGYPNGDQSGADGYDGIYLSGAQSVSINAPDVQTVPHPGDDRILAVDFLPPNAPISATLNTAKSNLEADATLSNTKVATVGDTQMGGLFTDKQGSEIDVALMYSRQALNTDPTSASFGSRRWQIGMFPKARLIPKGSGADQGGADQNVYNIVPTPAQAPPWGLAFSEATNGYTESPYLRFTSDNPARIERWDGDNTVTEFNLTMTPITTTKIAVYEDGVLSTISAVNTSTPSVTLSSAPANAAKVVAWYETSDDIG